jgi:hypothetical protein
VEEKKNDSTSMIDHCLVMSGRTQADDDDDGADADDSGIDHCSFV